MEEGDESSQHATALLAHGREVAANGTERIAEWILSIQKSTAKPFDDLARRDRQRSRNSLFCQGPLRDRPCAKRDREAGKIRLCAYGRAERIVSE